MRRTLATAAVAVSAAAAAVIGTTVAPAHAGPTCSETLGIEVHGKHVVGDYVIGTGHDGLWPPTDVGVQTREGGAALPGGPGPRFHFTERALVPPGASFCLANAESAHAVVHQQAADHVPALPGPR